MEITNYSMAQEARNTEHNTSWADRRVKLRDMRVNFVDAGFLPPTVAPRKEETTQPCSDEQDSEESDGTSDVISNGQVNSLDEDEDKEYGLTSNTGAMEASAMEEVRSDAGESLRPATPSSKMKGNNISGAKPLSSSPSSGEEEVVFVPRQHRKPPQDTPTVATVNGPVRDELAVDVTRSCQEQSEEPQAAASSRENQLYRITSADDVQQYLNGKKKYLKTASAEIAEGVQKGHASARTDRRALAKSERKHKIADRGQTGYQKGISTWLGADALKIPMGDLSKEWSPIEPTASEQQSSNESGGRGSRVHTGQDSGAESGSAGNIFTGVSRSQLQSFVSRDLSGGGIEDNMFYPKREERKTVSKATANARKSYWGDDDENERYKSSAQRHTALELLSENLAEARAMSTATGIDSPSDELSDGDEEEDEYEEADSEGQIKEIVTAAHKSEYNSNPFQNRQRGSGKSKNVMGDFFDEEELLDLVGGKTPDPNKYGGQFPDASSLADAYDDFDVTDYNRPSLGNYTKSRGKGKGKSASEGWEALAAAQEMDRERKKLKKSEREAQRKLGLLGIKEGGSPDLAKKYPTGMQDHDVRYELQRFLVSQNETLSFPAMDKALRRRIHMQANRLMLVSKSQGVGNNRYTRLHKTKAATARFENNHDAVEAAFKQSGAPRFKGPREGRHNSPHHRDGEIVGAGAKEIGPDNKGRRMLEKLGWNEGTGLGAARDGISAHVQAVIKYSKSGLG